MKIINTSILSAILLQGMAMGQDDAPEPVTVSIQVSVMSIPFHIAKNKGYFEDLGLDISTVVFKSGAPQVKAALDNKAWDVGIAGVVPNIIGGADGLTGIGICFDQSSINQFVANKAGVDAWPPETFDGVKIASTPNSTGDFVVQACLKNEGYDLSTIEFVYEQQGGVIEALTPVNETMPAQAMYGGLWAPNTYRFLENNEGSDTLCHGGTVYAKVTGGFMAREEWAAEHPDAVNKLLAGWLRGIVFVKNETNRMEVFDYMDEFFKENGVTLSRSAMAEDLRLIGLFELDEQISVMERSGEPPSSEYDFWTLEISRFMKDNGVVSDYPEPVDYITDKYMLNIKNDPILNAYARGEDVDLDRSDGPDDGDTSNAAQARNVLSIAVLSAVLALW